MIFPRTYETNDLLQSDNSIDVVQNAFNITQKFIPSVCRFAMVAETVTSRLLVASIYGGVARLSWPGRIGSG